MILELDKFYKNIMNGNIMDDEEEKEHENI
jgi:hypothetical protein